MSELTKQPESRAKKSDWRVLFDRSIKKSATENLEMKGKINNLKYRMFRIEQVLIERGVRY